MGLKLLKEYVNERYGHEVTEVPGGFAVYGVQPYGDGDSILFVQDFYVQKSQRGFTKKSSSRQLFNKLKQLASENYCKFIGAHVQLDTMNAQEILKLFLYLGFKAVNGTNTTILIMYEVKDGC
tara:strand:- start:634 stop:1002 length:369 start_codon:yes stop_codon:yes gene_type:complete